MKNLTREQAVQLVGESLVTAVEAENVEFTNASTDGTEYHGCTGFFASVKIPGAETELYDRLTMYVFVDTDIVKSTDLDEINWDYELRDAVYALS